jgi:hypothetical protein
MRVEPHCPPDSAAAAGFVTVAVAATADAFRKARLSIISSQSEERPAAPSEPLLAKKQEDAPVMRCDGGIDQVAPKGPKASEDAIFVGASEPGVADDVGYQDRRQFPRLAHGANAERCMVRSPAV